MNCNNEVFKNEKLTYNAQTHFMETIKYIMHRNFKLKAEIVPHKMAVNNGTKNLYASSSDFATKTNNFKFRTVLTMF